MLRKKEHYHTDGGKKNHCYPETEIKAFPDPAKAACTVIESADRHKTLAEAQHSRDHEMVQPGDNGHGGNGGVPIRKSGPVHENCRQTGQNLPVKGGQTVGKDQAARSGHWDEKRTSRCGRRPGPDGYKKAESETDELAQNRSPGRSGNTQIKEKDKDRIQNNV